LEYIVEVWKGDEFIRIFECLNEKELKGVLKNEDYRYYKKKGEFKFRVLKECNRGVNYVDFEVISKEVRC